MQNAFKFESINTFWKKADEIGSIEVDIPDPFCGDEEARKQHLENMKKRWADLDNHIGTDLDDWFKVT